MINYNTTQLNSKQNLKILNVNEKKMLNTGNGLHFKLPLALQLEITSNCNLKCPYTIDYGLFGVRFLFSDMKKDRRSIDELLIYFATPPLYFICLSLLAVLYAIITEDAAVTFVAITISCHNHPIASLKIQL